MDHRKILPFLAAIVFISMQPAWGQRVLLKTTGAKYAASLTIEDIDIVVESAQKALDNYVDAFTLLDKKQNRVNPEAVNKFRVLFGGTATLVQDYEEYIPLDMVDVETYCGNIANRMELEGLQVRLNQAILEEIIDEDPFWVVVIKAEKDFFNYVTADNEVKTIGGRVQDHEIRLDIPKSSINQPKIAKVSRRCRPEDKCDIVAADYSRYFGPTFSVFQPLVLSKTYGGYLGENSGAGELELKSEFGFSGGIDFFTNRMAPSASETKNLFLIAGLRFNYNRFTAKLTGYNFEVLDTAAKDNISPEKQAYLRKGFNIEATEELTVGTVELPLGLGFRLKRKQGFDVFLQAKVLPSYSILLGDGTLTGVGDYDATINDANWSLLEQQAAKEDSKSNDGTRIFDQSNTYGPFLAGENRKLSGTTKPTLGGFGLAAQLSPVVTFHLSGDNPNWSLLIGADITYHFMPLFKFSGTATDILLKYPNDKVQTYNKTIDNNQSLVQHYFKSLSLLDVGIRIGLLHRFLDEP